MIRIISCASVLYEDGDATGFLNAPNSACNLRRNRSGEEMRAKIQVQFQGEEGEHVTQEAIMSFKSS